MLSGIHSTKLEEFLFLNLAIVVSASIALMFLPRNRQEAVRTLPCVYRSPASLKRHRESNICAATCWTLSISNFASSGLISGAWLCIKKCRRGNGIRLVLSFLMSQLFWNPGKRKEAVVFDIT